MLVVHLQRVSVSNGAAPRNADRSLHACLTATVMQKPQHSHISCVALKAACKGGGAGVSAPAEGVARRLAGRRDDQFRLLRQVVSALARRRQPARRGPGHAGDAGPDRPGTVAVGRALGALRVPA